jgi:hypothetical protein
MECFHCKTLNKNGNSASIVTYSGENISPNDFKSTEEYQSLILCKDAHTKARSIAGVKDQRLKLRSLRTDLFM